VTGRAGLDWLGPGEAAEVGERTPGGPASPEAAREKLVFCDRRGETLVYQADRPSRSAALCACGNATGAAAALLAQSLGEGRFRQDVRLPDGRVALLADARRAGPAWRVAQSWGGLRVEVRPAVLRGRAAAVCTGTLNDYLLVRLGSARELAEFDLPEALALWAEGRAFGAFADPLRSRLVALAPAGARPQAKFYTCGRAHPGAPLTGLATLALASPRVGWLAELLAGRQLEHRRGVDAIPDVEGGPAGCALRLPAIDVALAAA
jgi:hypothetical protein